MNWLSKCHSHISELGFAENNLIQVLLHNFSVYRAGQEVQLEIRFDHQTPTIRRREAKEALRMSMPGFEKKAKLYQTKLDSILLDQSRNRKMFIHNDQDFVFRYASGGTLPILTIGGQEYYCLFYRDSYPVGWNIANGACDSLDELLNPLIAVKRELREELIILNFSNEEDYLFSWDAGKTLDRPEFTSARNLWQRQFPMIDFKTFRELKILLDWGDGPDLLNITMGDNSPITLSGCFLNINALDFGIEVDKIAKFSVGENSVLLDGEIVDHQLLNRPIGLFSVQAMEKLILTDHTRFVPEIIFHSGRNQSGKSLDEIVLDNYAFMLERQGIRDHKQAQQLRSNNNRYDLCPVTRSIIRRYLLHKAAQPTMKNKSHELFISYSSKDETFAQQLHSDLRKEGVGCWFAPYDLGIGEDMRSAIEAAIHDCEKLLVVFSEDSIHSPWVRTEVELALEEETRRGEMVLFPISLDSTALNTREPWVKQIRRVKNIGRFECWKDANSYQESFQHLLRGIRAKRSLSK